MSLTAPTTATAHTMSQTIVNSLQQATGLELAVLALLVIFSVISWAVILLKWIAVRRLQAGNDRFLDLFNRAEHTGVVLESGAAIPGAVMFTAFKQGLDTLKVVKNTGAAPASPDGFIPLNTPVNLREKVQQSMVHAAQAEFARLRAGTDFLASIGSSSPFIGLFGTVWGIMGTFQMLGNAKSASLNVVAPGIASALIATAAGLAVAIPAVMGYNWIMARIDDEQERVTAFTERALLLIQPACWNDHD